MSRTQLRAGRRSRSGHSGRRGRGRIAIQKKGCGRQRTKWCNHNGMSPMRSSSSPNTHFWPAFGRCERNELNWHQYSTTTN